MSTVGGLLREWRGMRRMSQLELAVATGVSARHLSFVETGRSRPTREMILRLSQELAVPLRSQNRPARRNLGRPARRRGRAAAAAAAGRR